MIIMALDHVRDYFHVTAFTQDPLDPQTSYPALYFTRWITHFCAPIFVFLAGTSAYLMGLKKSKTELSRFLVTRGVWLVLIEVTIVTLGWTFNPLFNLFILQVIWAIGISMIILGLLIYLPWSALLIIGIIIVGGHNVLDPVEAARDHKVGVLWDFVHHGHFAPYPLAQNRIILIVYAFLPWTGIMILGYCFGRLFKSSVSHDERRKWLLIFGAGLLLLFVLLRYSNVYGDPQPWSPQGSFTRSMFSFLNVDKYPPSLLFFCITIGVACLMLVLLERIQNRFTRIVMIYGRVPFFYYILHLYLIHALGVIAFFASGYTSKDIVDQQSPFLFRPLQFGYSLWAVYGVWILVVLLLYPLCRWYNAYKSTHKKWWLSYV
jgi:uncharacterized membrane protein